MKKTLVVLMLFVMIISVGCAKEAVLKQEDVSNIGNNEVEKSNEISVTDVSGKEIILSEKPEKVISLYASFADLWYEAGGDLVGICDSRTLPEQVADLPKVGKMSTPNVEAILALEPDFIIVRDGYVKQEEIIPLLIENNIVVYLANYNNFSEMLKVYKDFCLINGNENLYQEKGISMENKINEIVKDKLEFNYLLLFATSKSVSAKDGNITSDIINGFGGENITTKYQIADEESKQFSFEKILEIDPKFIFVQTMGSVEKAKERLEKDIILNPAWSSLSAVKEGRFIYLPKELFLYKPNMKFVEAYEYMRELLEVIK